MSDDLFAPVENFFYKKALVQNTPIFKESTSPPYIEVETNSFSPKYNPLFYKHMTRGTIVLLLEDAVLISDEFNGDMDFETLGYKVISYLGESEVATESAFTDMVSMFNEENHDYEDVSIHTKSALEIYTSDDKYRVVMQSALGISSDYTYIKNATGGSVRLETTLGKSIVMEDMCVAVLNFDKRAFKTYNE